MDDVPTAGADIGRNAPSRTRAAPAAVAAQDRFPRPAGVSGSRGADGPFGGPTGPDRASGGWWAWAACRDMDPDLWFPAQSTSVRAAKRVCRVCPVQLNCLTDALGRGELYGVWGGTSEEERRLIRAVRRTDRKTRRTIAEPFAKGFAKVEVEGDDDRAA
ncbi:WhiB family transcriptional regulator [Nocardiopsis metallicus]|uniref:Transcriptional regulator WhiB n=1 Tax=Nocardiopsis metallicus TaxID=179819 RepID=A0A840WRF6_9ACTN|nr:WhiB family transcriptional regulator [Nocardiopsis metallicus]MBB5494236.1 hypothetical protein [Nocardiopsis metallicus]